jgi:hypothetical protein
MPRETLERLFGAGRDMRFVRGNADREAAEGSGEHGASWVVERLTAEQRDFLGRLPLTEQLDLRGWVGSSSATRRQEGTRRSSPA